MAAKASGIIIRKELHTPIDILRETLNLGPEVEYKMEEKGAICPKMTRDKLMDFSGVYSVRTRS